MVQSPFTRSRGTSVCYGTGDVGDKENKKKEHQKIKTVH